MWWKTIVKWVRDRVDVELDVDLDGRAVVVELTVRFNGAVLLAERFEWALPAAGGPVARLKGGAARRTRLSNGN